MGLGAEQRADGAVEALTTASASCLVSNRHETGPESKRRAGQEEEKKAKAEETVEGVEEERGSRDRSSWSNRQLRRGAAALSRTARTARHCGGGKRDDRRRASCGLRPSGLGWSWSWSWSWRLGGSGWMRVGQVTVRRQHDRQLPLRARASLTNAACAAEQHQQRAGHGEQARRRGVGAVDGCNGLGIANSMGAWGLAAGKNKEISTYGKEGKSKSEESARKGKQKQSTLSPVVRGGEGRGGTAWRALDRSRVPRRDDLLFSSS